MGLCTETPRTQATGKQCVCTLSLANVAQTCRDDGVSVDHIITFRLTERSEVVSGGDLEDSRRRRGRSCRRGLSHVFRCCCTQGPGCPGARVKDIWEDRVLGRETHGVEVLGVLAVRCILTPDLWASARDVSSMSLCSLSWACLSTRLRICLSTASSSSCTECLSNVCSPALKCRHKSAIKPNKSETMAMCVIKQMVSPFV